MKRFVISKNDSDQRLDKFLSKAVKKLPQSLMYKYIRTKRIKVNAKRCEISQRLQIGDVVELYINDEFFMELGEKDFLFAAPTVDVVYEDENILLVNKKPGLVVHEDDENTIDTLINRIKHYLFKKGEYNPDNELSFVPSLCNRIDRNTGGIVIAAKNAAALRILNEKIKNREVIKKYLCVVHGKLSENHAVLMHYLKKDTEQNKVFVNNQKLSGYKTIITEYDVIDYKNGLSLVEVNLQTGRTHQIRAHFAHIGHPLLGDGKYGKNAEDKARGYKYQALYSYKLIFDFCTDSGELDYLKGKCFEIKNIRFKEAFLNQ
jgi:23S rRNA pseudouridine955/2504/2580 synthase